MIESETEKTKCSLCLSCDNFCTKTGEEIPSKAFRGFDLCACGEHSEEWCADYCNE